MLTTNTPLRCLPRATTLLMGMLSLVTLGNHVVGDTNLYKVALRTTNLQYQAVTLPIYNYMPTWNVCRTDTASDDQVLIRVLININLIITHTRVHENSHHDTMNSSLSSPNEERLYAYINATVVVNRVCCSSMNQCLEYYDDDDDACLLYTSPSPRDS